MGAGSTWPGATGNEKHLCDPLPGLMHPGIYVVHPFCNTIITTEGYLCGVAFQLYDTNGFLCHDSYIHGSVAHINKDNAVKYLCTAQSRCVFLNRQPATDHDMDGVVFVPYSLAFTQREDDTNLWSGPVGQGRLVEDQAFDVAGASFEAVFSKPCYYPFALPNTISSEQMLSSQTLDQLDKDTLAVPASLAVNASTAWAMSRDNANRMIQIILDVEPTVPANDPLCLSVQVYSGAQVGAQLKWQMTILNPRGGRIHLTTPYPGANDPNGGVVSWKIQVTNRGPTSLDITNTWNRAANPSWQTDSIMEALGLLNITPCVDGLSPRTVPKPEGRI